MPAAPTGHWKVREDNWTRRLLSGRRLGNVHGARWLARSPARRAEQVPSVAFEVEEDDDAAVCLLAGFGDEPHAVVEHSLPGRVEVIDAEEEADTSCELLADCAGLLLTIGSREQQPRLRTRRPHDDPSLRSPIVGHRRRILDDLEAQGIDEEPNGIVVVPDDQREVLHVHGATIGVVW